MPNLDKTGPQGLGPTGRGQGDCVDNAKASDFVNGRGCGRGISKGLGFCAMEQGDKAVLEAQIKAHQAKIDAMQARLDGLEIQDK